MLGLASALPSQLLDERRPQLSEFQYNFLNLLCSIARESTPESSEQAGTAINIC